MKERKEERERGAEQEPGGKKLRKEQQDYFHSHLLKCKKTQCCYSSSSQLHKTVSERSCQTMFHTKCSALLSHELLRNSPSYKLLSCEGNRSFQCAKNWIKRKKSIGSSHCWCASVWAHLRVRTEQSTREKHLDTVALSHRTPTFKI